MKRTIVVLLVGFMLLAFSGAVFAKSMGGKVVEMDATKCTFALEHGKKGKMTERFNCEDASLIKDIKVGQHVAVEYDVSGDKNMVTKVTPMSPDGLGGWK